MSEFIVLEKSLEKLFLDRDPFKVIEELDGIIYREYANRITKEFCFNNETYFVKYHKGVGWKEIFKNIFQLKQPVLGAKQEWSSLHKLKTLQISCPEPVGFASKGINPAKRHSFIITRALNETISLEDLFLKQGDLVLSPIKRRELLENIALISRKMHKQGLNHRDFYLCHFHINKNLDVSHKGIFLIDLHRAQMRKRVPRRWATKDIGGLFHSAMDLGLTERDCYRFLKIYFDMSLRDIFQQKIKFIEILRKRAFAMYMEPILEEINISSQEDKQLSSVYLKGNKENMRWIANKEFFDQGLSEVINNPDHFISKGEEIKSERGHHIVKINLNNDSIYIKKYQIKGLLHYFRKFFSQTRALTAWKASHWFSAAGINTIKPLAVVEKYDNFTTTDSYLISLEQLGTRLDRVDFSKENYYLIQNKLTSFIKRLKWINFNHGDAKSSNFFLFENKLFVLDLDISKKRNFKFIFKNKINKDIKRILKSFDHNLKIKDSLSRRFY